MALIFCDSFDHYATTYLATKYTALSGTPPTIASSGRFGSRIEVGNANRWASLTLPSSQATWIMGAAYFVNGTTIAGHIIFSLYDGSTRHVELRVLSDFRLQVTRNGTVLGTSTATIRTAWSYIEFKVTIDDSAGAYEVRLNGVNVLSASSVDTRNGANASANVFYFWNDSVGATTGTPYAIDDFYICDTTGSTNNDFLGDVRVEALFPNGNGNSSQWVGSDGNSTDNYLLVDESPPNEDTDYVEASTVGDKDTYAYTDLTLASGTVYGVQLLPYARKTDAGSRSIVSVARLSSTETDSSDKALLTSYAYLPDIRETKPGGGAWTISDVNSAEFGVKVSV
jgi:hypothetical protein